MARPPARGIGRVFTRREFGRSTIRWRSTTRRMSGVRMAARSAAAANTARIGPMLDPTSSMNVTGASSRGRQPRYREAGDDLGDLAGQPTLDRRVVAGVDRLDDDPTDGPHLVLAEATGRGGRRA